MRRVVITGQGTINALGHDVPTTLEAMREGRCGIGPLELRDVERLSVRIGGQVAAMTPRRCSTASRSRFMTGSRNSPDRGARGARQRGADLRRRSRGALGRGAGHGGRRREHLGRELPLGLRGGEEPRASLRRAEADEQRRGQPCVDGMEPQGPVLLRRDGLRLVEPRDGAGVPADPRRRRRRDGHRRVRGDAVLRRHQGVGRPARDVQGRLPPVLGQPQRHGAGRGRGRLRLRGIRARPRAGPRSWPRSWVSP
jgi:hypothetical protein